MSLYIYVYLMTKDEDNKCIKLHNNGWSKEEWCMNVRKKRKNNTKKRRIILMCACWPARLLGEV